MRWLTKSTVRSPIGIKINKNKNVQISLMRPKFNIKPIYVNDAVEFDISIEAEGAITDMEENISLPHLKEKIKGH
ncbi:hypothetical protein KEH51_26210 [[Brevibacterium] frigoritolerans]|uniref:Spore germination GerAC-like C-terminal domain-containing protein n=1 Tax=Peribacillus frigoritolerans TaxID=450367 RepID=A0A941FNM9_9BACI|nr:hypothetical protein [Peribacillus frigoritolerans]